MVREKIRRDHAKRHELGAIKIKQLRIHLGELRRLRNSSAKISLAEPCGRTEAPEKPWRHSGHRPAETSSRPALGKVWQAAQRVSDLSNSSQICTRGDPCSTDERNTMPTVRSSQQSVAGGPSPCPDPPEFPQSTPLPQQVPALVQLDLQPCQALPVLVGKLALSVQLLLFFHQPIDVV